MNRNIEVRGGSLILNGGRIENGLTVLIDRNTTFRGFGSIQATKVNNLGEFNPEGTVDIAGDFDQDPSGNLNIRVSFGPSVDRLNVSGTVTAQGALTATLTGGFIPAVGSTFKFLTFATLVRGAGNIAFPLGSTNLGNNLFFALLINQNDLTFETRQVQ